MPATRGLARWESSSDGNALKPRDAVGFSADGRGHRVDDCRRFLQGLRGAVLRALLEIGDRAVNEPNVEGSGLSLDTSEHSDKTLVTEIQQLGVTGALGGACVLAGL